QRGGMTAAPTVSGSLARLRPIIATDLERAADFLFTLSITPDHRNDPRRFTNLELRRGATAAPNETIPGLTLNTQLTYDSTGRVATETTNGLTTTYSYDAASQLVRAETSTGSAQAGSPCLTLSVSDGSGENEDGTSRNTHLVEITTCPATYGMLLAVVPSVSAVN
ncbi:MAG TPA: hypothetical protein PK020_11665, partial [Ilumatobacteraceae bacterium]|nr:hypothetical protein [Ilumatobacteraceae bacterium]HRB03902.1 hypothetical protein [Ilumatobacteraceae bacterium]